jgi:hypothetical protein
VGAESEQCDERKEHKKLRIMEETAAPRHNKKGAIVFIQQISLNAQDLSSVKSRTQSKRKGRIIR